MMQALNVYAQLDEMLWGSRLSPQGKDEAIKYLEYILKILDYNRSIQHGRGGILGTGLDLKPSSGFTTPEREEALQFLQDKRIITPATRPGGQDWKHRYQYRADFERAVAYYRMLTGNDPDFLEIFPETGL